MAVLIFEKIFTSSDDDHYSDEQLEADLDHVDEEVHRCHHQLRAIPRINNFVENIVYSYTDADF